MNWLSSAPANLMLLGEHSVVYGHPALACAVNQYIEIHWSKTDDNTICIESALANFQFTLNELKHFEQHSELDHPQLRFVMHALKAFSPYLNHGLHLEIKSEFSSTIGLGSSAAVLAAMLHGLNQITQQQLDNLQLFNLGHEIILTIQGRGSGTDLAASLTGGVVLFEPKSANRPAHIQKLPESISQNLPLTLIYCGYKTPTADVLKMVADNWQSKPDQLTQLYALMGETTKQAYQALLNGQMEHFYAFSEIYQDFMDSLGVNDKTLQMIIEKMSDCKTIFASKISGSGLGDCVLGFGSLSDCPTTSQDYLKPFTQIEVEISPTGTTTEQLN
ncbi:MAG: mevalonate kinase [Pseudomonadota bacterium]|nr:mevalonate kinase [Pseudomonadota bacterium]